MEKEHREEGIRGTGPAETQTLQGILSPGHSLTNFNELLNKVFMESAKFFEGNKPCVR